MLRFEFQGREISIDVSDEPTIDRNLRALHLLGGWSQLQAIRHDLEGRVYTAKEGLRTLQDGSVTASPAVVRGIADTTGFLKREKPALDAWTAGCERFGKVLFPVLKKVERDAIAYCDSKTTDSLTEIQAQAHRYLTGFGDSIFEKTKDLKFPRSTSLAANADVRALRSALDELSRAQRGETVERLASTLQVAIASTALPELGVLMAYPEVKKAVARSTVLAAQRDRFGGDHPVLFRLDAPDAGDLSDEVLGEQIGFLLSRTWAAARTVKQRSSLQMVNDGDGDSPDGPISAIGRRLSSLHPGFLDRLRGQPVGPWEYQPAMWEAVTDRHGPGQSMARQGVADVYHAADPELADGFKELSATMAALTMLHLAAPGLAVVADIILALKGIAEHILEFLRKSDAYNCTLDPAESLGVHPTYLRLALECAGEAAAAAAGPLAKRLPAGKFVGALGVVLPLSAQLFD